MKREKESKKCCKNPNFDYTTDFNNKPMLICSNCKRVLIKERFETIENLRKMGIIDETLEN